MAEEAEKTIIEPAAPAPAEPMSIRESLTQAAEAIVPADAQTIDTGDKPRGPDGKFAKAPDAAQTTLELKPPVGAEPQQDTGTIRPPTSWSATAKADFATLPEHIQKEVLKREGEIEAGKAQWDQKGARFNRLESILGPRQDRFKLAGIEETQALQALFAAQDMLESSDPRIRASAIQDLARRSGVDLRSFAGTPQQQPQQVQLPPEVQQALAEVHSLKQTIAQQQTAANQQTATETQTQIDAFARDPANLYFANVRGDMAALITSGQATGLKDAYEKATWANPEIRPLLMREHQTTAQAAQAEQARARSEAARRASGSVTGSPTPGSSSLNGGPAPSIREELMRAAGS